ncbi:hypothetical protein A0J61_09718 [Choanephora cucurbitarum]|uniref:Uncharacterized protein n=1 Tax=Choanephora cucurbitarum TaxID=101091 RepID=A0A1C7MZN3_9FUNG|nr:hypothetical protein A0J61_09718 [Choanephora cucurbitarum]
MLATQSIDTYYTNDYCEHSNPIQNLVQPSPSKGRCYNGSKNPVVMLPFSLDVEHSPYSILHQASIVHTIYSIFNDFIIPFALHRAPRFVQSS